MDFKKLIIIGAGGHGRVVQDVALSMGKWDEILKMKLVSDTLKYPRAISHYAKGMAYLGKKDFKKAKPALAKLPSNARAAVTLSYSYYYELLQKLELASVEEIKLVRVRISDLKKVHLLIAAKLTQKSIKKESRS